MSKIEKITWKELDNFLREHHDRSGVIVFKQHPSWEKQYSVEGRSYRVHGTDYHFQDGKISKALWGFCLDETLPDADGVRLDWYIYARPEERWVVDYCYILDK